MEPKPDSDNEQMFDSEPQSDMSCYEESSVHMNSSPPASEISIDVKESEYSGACS